MGRLAKVLSGQCQPGLKAFKKGGKAQAHSDEEEDMALIRGSVKPSALLKKKAGGKVCHASGGKIKGKR